MTTDDAEMIALAVARALQQARSVSDSEHYDHHVWITAHIESEKKREEFYTQMKLHVAKWGSVSIFSILLYALWLYVKHELRK